MLKVDLLPGPAGTTPLLMAHGLFGSGRNLGVIAKRLSATRQVTLPDMRNHGESRWYDTHSYPDLAADLGALIPDRWDVFGHSMGGKAAMALALTEPQKVRKLIVADIAPVAYGHTQMPMIDAMRAINLDAIASRSDADAQLAPNVAEPGVRAFLLQSLDIKHRRWRLNLDVLSSDMDHILGFPEFTTSFDGPTLFLSGGDSNYVQPEHRTTVKRLFPKAVFAKIPGASHWLHADKPREVEASIAAFLDR